MDAIFTELKTEIVNNLEPFFSATPEYKRVRNAKNVDKLMDIIKNDFYFFAKEGIIIPSLLKKYRKVFERAQIYCNKNVKHGFLLLDDNQQTGALPIMYATGAPTVFACGHTQLCADLYATVYATEHASVDAYNCTIVHACDNTKINGRHHVTIYAGGQATLKILHNTTAHVCDKVTVYAYDYTNVQAGGYATVYAHENANVQARNNTVVTACGHVYIDAADNAYIRSQSELRCNLRDHAIHTIQSTNVTRCILNNMKIENGNKKYHRK